MLTLPYVIDLKDDEDIEFQLKRLEEINRQLRELENEDEEDTEELKATEDKMEVDDPKSDSSDNSSSSSTSDEEESSTIHSLKSSIHLSPDNKIDEKSITKISKMEPTDEFELCNKEPSKGVKRNRDEAFNVAYDKDTLVALVMERVMAELKKDLKCSIENSFIDDNMDEYESISRKRMKLDAYYKLEA